MLDLTKKNLPSSIYVEGKFFKIHTDFRFWLNFSNILNCKKENVFFSDVAFLFPFEIPSNYQEGFDELINFYNPLSILPRPSQKKNKKLLDYVYDADLIYASFYQAYHIDLFDISLHWHKFLALLNNMQNTPLSEIVGYRNYEGKDKDLNDLNQRWKIPDLPLMRGTQEELNRAIKERDEKELARRW